MLKIKFPVIFNSNFQVQDQDGAVLADLWRVKATPPEIKEWGEILCGLLNEEQNKATKFLKGNEPTCLGEGLNAPTAVMDGAFLPDPTTAISPEIRVDAQEQTAPPSNEAVGQQAVHPPVAPASAPVKRRGGNPAFRKGFPNPYSKPKPGSNGNGPNS